MNAESRADFSTNSMWMEDVSEGGLVIGVPRIKRSLQSHVGGGGAVQNVQEPNLHHFDQQI